MSPAPFHTFSLNKVSLPLCFLHVVRFCLTLHPGSYNGRKGAKNVDLHRRVRHPLCIHSGLEPPVPFIHILRRGGVQKPRENNKMY